MTEAQLLEWSKAVSAIAAVSALLWSIFIWRRGEKAKEILAWQQVVVFKIIKDAGECTFKGISQEYLNESQKSNEKKLLQKDIKDDALRLVLMGLLEKKLISINRDEKKPSIETYSINYTLQDEIEKEYKQRAIEEFDQRKTFHKAQRKIIEIVSKDEGRHTQDSLFRAFTKEGLGIDDVDYIGLVQGLRQRRVIVIEEDGKFKLGNPDNMPTKTVTTTRTVYKEPPPKPIRPLSDVFKDPKEE